MNSDADVDAGVVDGAGETNSADELEKHGLENTGLLSNIHRNHSNDDVSFCDKMRM